jgi:putative transcriptional regulator
MLRAVKRLSQKQLAEAAGISRQTVANIESGRHKPTIGVALAIAKAFSEPVDKVFYLVHASPDVKIGRVVD